MREKILVWVLLFLMVTGTLSAKVYDKTSFYATYDPNDNRQFVLYMPMVNKIYTHMAGKIKPEDLLRIDDQFIDEPQYNNGELCFSMLKKGASGEHGAALMAGQCYTISFFYTQKEHVNTGMTFILTYARGIINEKVYEGLAGVSESFKVVRDGENIYNENSLSGDDYNYFSFNKRLAKVTMGDMPANTPPVANAGPSQNVKTGSTVQLNGSGSTDINGDRLTYQWRIGSKPEGSNATLTNPTFVNPTFVADRSGNYIIELVVNDGKVDSAVDYLIVASSRDNQAPVADAGKDQNIHTETTVFLDASKSYDINDDEITYHWIMISQPEESKAKLSDSNISMPTFVVDAEGAYVFELTVNDGVLDSTPDYVVVTATDGNAPPVANAGADQDVKTGDKVNLDGSNSSDADGNNLTYRWTFASIPDGSKVVLNDSTSVRPNFTADVVGSYVLQLMVNDGTVNSMPDIVVVRAYSDNAPPVANAGADQDVKKGSLIRVDASASRDPDGDILTYNWYIVSKPSGSNSTLDDPTNVQPTMMADTTGYYILGLTVSDGKLESSADRVIIRVSASEVKSIYIGSHDGVICHTGTSLRMFGVSVYDNGTVKIIEDGITWNSSDTSVATVDQSGKVTCVSKGTSSISIDDDTHSNERGIIVLSPALKSIVLSSSAGQSLPVNTESRMQAFGIYDDGSKQNITHDVVWSSLNDSIATIDTNGVLKALEAGTTTITATIQNIESTFQISVTNASLTAVYLYSTKGSPILVKTDVKMRAFGVYSDGNITDITNTATWSSSDQNIATVTSQGLVTAKSTGTVKITASVGKQTNEYALEIVKPSIIAIQLSTPTGINIKKGTSSKFYATAILNNGESVDITSVAYWSSKNSTIATVSNDSKNAGLVTGVEVGNTIIEVNYLGVQSSIKVHIETPNLTALFLSKNKENVYAGLDVELTATGIYEDDSSRDLSNDVAWISENSAVATVDSSGLVTTLSEGNVTITAALGDVYASTLLEVGSAILTDITIITATDTLPDGLSIVVKSAGTFSDGNISDITSNTSWSVSEPSIVEIVTNSDGRVFIKALKPGSVTLTAYAQGVTATKSFTVTEATVQSIDINASTNKVQLDATLNLIAYAHMSDGTKKIITNDVTWTSNDTDIATVTTTGVVTGNSLGTTIIHSIYDDMRAEFKINVIDPIMETNVSTTAEFRAALSNAATNGMNNKIILTDGIYKTTDDGKGTFEYLSNNDKKLILTGESRENTILSGEEQDRILNFNSLEKPSLKVEKLTFKDGKKIGGQGGGIYAVAYIDVVDCNFTNNSVDGSYGEGGGFYSYGGGRVLDSIFEGNKGGSWGAGGFKVDYGYTEVNSSRFENNTAKGGAAGFYAYSLKVTNSIFINNRATSGNGGGFRGVHDVVVENSIFINNWSRYWGGGFNANEVKRITNSVFISNNAPYYNGGAFTTSGYKKSEISNILLKDNSSGIRITEGNNCIIVNSIFINSTDNEIDGEDGAIVTLKNNYINPNKINSTVFKENNIFDGVNLGFVDENNSDFHLKSSSDLIDAGLTTDSDVEIPTEDYDGVSRPQGTSTDIGPYEYKE